MQRITPMLWFDGQAEEAAKFYVSVFKNSKIKTFTHYGDEPPGRKGQVMTVDFVLDGEDFTALNGGPHFKFTEAISFSVECTTQEEVDYAADLIKRKVAKLRDLSPLWEMYKDGVDLNSVQWAAH